MTASNESFSAPVQVPRMWTVPPILPDAVLLVPQAVTPSTTMAIAARIRVSLPIGLLPPFGRTAARRDHAEVPRTPWQRVYDRPPGFVNEFSPHGCAH